MLSFRGFQNPRSVLRNTILYGTAAVLLFALLIGSDEHVAEIMTLAIGYMAAAFAVATLTTIPQAMPRTALQYVIISVPAGAIITTALIIGGQSHAAEVMTRGFFIFLAQGAAYLICTRFWKYVKEDAPAEVEK